jgi:putative ABC transport system substrate-binding protein
VTNLIEAGLIKSLPHPGGNATGTSTSHEQGFAGKWVELLWEILPALSTIAVLHNPCNPSNVSYWTVLQLAAQKLGIQLQSLEVWTVEALENALETIARSHPDALIVATDPFLFAHQARILEAVRAHLAEQRHGADCL